MVLVAKLSLSPRTLAANRDKLYAHVPAAISREQHLKQERERKQAFRDRKKQERMQKLAETTVETQQMAAVREAQERPDVELTVEIIRD